ncbi:MFS transporter [Helicobacter aurati]|uniref:MFS transporter n=1 Tax=Helicobacter aurati TaxID=137778 RepID=A0A3D8IX51_9HELI|nr:MFS transporter [Helicobacter aurati]RDU69832.1 MFS transporter [Helicobacter aurati]
MSSKPLLLVLLPAVFVVPSSISGTAIALPHIAENLGADSALLAWVVNAFNLCFACFTLIWGALSDRFDVRACFVAGVALYLVGSLLSSFAPALLWLDIARACAGVGGASVFACGSALLRQSFEAESRARAFALFGTTAGLGITFGPTISGILIDFISWRAIFLFHSFILALVLCFAAKGFYTYSKNKLGISSFTKPHSSIPTHKQRISRSFDSKGALLFVAFMLSLMQLIMNLHALKEPKTLSITTLCLCLFCCFVLQQKRLSIKYANCQDNAIPQPFLDVAVLKNTAFLGFSLVTVVAGFSFVVLLTYFPSFLSAIFGFSAFQTGAFMLALTTPMLFCPLVAARLINKGMDSKKFALAISLVMSLGIFLLLFILYFLSGWIQMGMIAFVLFIIGCGMGLHAGAIDGLALSKVESSKAGLAAGVLNSFRLGSEAIGVALYAALCVAFLNLYAFAHFVGYDIDFIHSFISIVSSGNLSSLEDRLYHHALSFYKQATFISLWVLGALCLFLSLIIGLLLRK